MSTRQAETYAIINITDLPLIDFSQIGETGENTIRKSLDELQFLIKWNTEPTFIADGTVVPVQTMSHRQSLIVMNNSKWQQPMPVD
tara:strand:- start:1021 stop:1278 length:258 start_codon:yes stop_codon:yes gene_type:complete